MVTKSKRQDAHWAKHFFVAVFFFATACASAEPASLLDQTRVSPVVAVGDIHGDYEAYMAILRRAGIVDSAGEWAGGDTRFVQLGDVPDRGPDTRKILDHLMALEKQATRAGGAVIALIGNHEAMNITGDLRYVHPGEYAAFATATSPKLRDQYYRANVEAFTSFYRGESPTLTDKQVRAAFEEDFPLGYVEHRRAWAADGVYGRWISKHDAVHIIDQTLFVHGGISAEYADRSIKSINDEVRAALTGAGPADILTDELGPLWHRGNAQETADGAQAVDLALEAYDIDRIIVGHTPQLSGVQSRYGGKVLLIDTGMSAHYGGVRSYVRIEGDIVTAVDGGRSQTLTTPEAGQ
ncbi:MAG: metallophosphoesterase [Pseudomonadota bacterium]